jgi:hypothetical protein
VSSAGGGDKVAASELRDILQDAQRHGASWQEGGADTADTSSGGGGGQRRNASRYTAQQAQAMQVEAEEGGDEEEEPEEVQEARSTYRKLKVPELRAELTQRGLDATGLKSALVERLVEAGFPDGGAAQGTKRKAPASPWEGPSRKRAAARLSSSQRSTSPAEEYDMDAPSDEDDE